MTIRSLRRFRPNSGNVVAVSQRNRKGRLDPASGLFETSRYSDGDSIDPGPAFPDKTLPMTFAIDIARNGSSPVGVIFEIGSDTGGTALWVEDGTTNIKFSAGDDVATDDGLTITATGAIVADDDVLKIVVAVLPGSGEAKMWINGKLVAAGQSVSGTMPQWTSGALGAVGEISGTVIDRVTSGSDVNLSDVDIVSPLRIYYNQLPKGFAAQPNSY